jgi:hypothetical protein
MTKIIPNPLKSDEISGKLNLNKSLFLTHNTNMMNNQRFNTKVPKANMLMKGGTQRGHSL